MMLGPHIFAGEPDSRFNILINTSASARRPSSETFFRNSLTSAFVSFVLFPAMMSPPAAEQYQIPSRRIRAHPRKFVRDFAILIRSHTSPVQPSQTPASTSCQLHTARVRLRTSPLFFLNLVLELSLLFSF